MRISDWSSDVCSSDLGVGLLDPVGVALGDRHGGGVGGAVADQALIGGVHLALGDKSGGLSLDGVVGVSGEVMVMGLVTVAVLPPAVVVALGAQAVDAIVAVASSARGWPACGCFRVRSLQSTDGLNELCVPKQSKPSSWGWGR